MAYFYADLTEHSSHTLISRRLVSAFNRYIQTIERPNVHFSARRKDDGIITIECNRVCLEAGEAGIVHDLIDPPIFADVESFRNLGLKIQHLPLPGL